MAIEIEGFNVEMKMDENGKIVFTISIRENNNFVVIPAETVDEAENGFTVCFTYKGKNKCLTLKID